MSTTVRGPLDLIPESQLQAESADTQLATMEETELVGRIMRLVRDAQDYQSRWSGTWEPSYNYYVGNHHRSKPSRYRTYHAENYVFTKLQTVIPIMTDGRPKIDITALDPAFQQYSDIRQREIAWNWRRQRMDVKTVEGSLNSLMFGNGFYNNYFDKKTKQVKTDSVDPQCMFANSAATSMDDAAVIIRESSMLMSEIEQTWPGAFGKISGSGRGMIGNPREYREMGIEGDRWSPPMGRSYTSTGAQGPIVPYSNTDMGFGTARNNRSQVLDLWIRDPAVDYVVTDYLLESGEPAWIERPRYPGARNIVLCCDRIIHDSANPNWHGRIPYTKQDCHKMPGEFWSLSMAHNLLPLNREINKTMGQLMDNKNFVSWGKWLIPAMAQITPEQMTADPFRPIVFQGTQPPIRDTGKALPSYVVQIVEFLLSAIDNVSGVFDVTQGRKPSGITAGVAIESLQEAANNRIRLLVRNLEDAIRDIGEQWVGLQQQYYEEDRHVPMIDPATGQTVYLTLTPEMVQSQWDVQVTPGSTMPQSREARQRDAIELFKLGIVDEQAVLERVNWPDMQQVLGRVMVQKAQQAMMEREQMMRQGSGKPAAA